MMRKLVLLILFLTALVSVSVGQFPLNENRFADSLTNLLTTTKSDSVKARLNFVLVQYWATRDTVKARTYLDAGRKLAGKDNILLGASYATEGVLQFRFDGDKSEALFRIADSLIAPYQHKEALGLRTSFWVNIAGLRQRKDDDRAYLDILLNKAMPLAQQAGDSASLGSLNVSIGLAFMNTEQYDKAENYLGQAIAYLDNPRVPISRLVSAYNRASENYILLKKYPEAKAILDKLQVILEPEPNSEWHAGYYMVEGMYYHELKEYSKAIASYDKGIASAIGQLQAYRIHELEFMKIKSLLANKNFEQARQVLMSLHNDEEAMSLVDNEVTIYKGLADANAGLGRIPAAYEWLRKYSTLADSLYQTKLRNDINALETKFRTVENEKKISDLKAANEQASLSAKNSRLINWLLASAAAILLIVAIFSLLFYRNSKKLSRQKDLNHQQQLKEIAQEQQLQVSQALLQGEERERRRVAGDLHDGLGGMLAGIKMNLTDLTGSPEKVQGPELGRVMGQLDNSISELRRIARNLMPEALLKFGLETALRDLCGTMMSDNVRVNFQSLGIESDIAQPVQVTIYRIIQELLTNAVRHGKASDILVQCSQNKDTFYITLEDNGKGFDTSIAKNAKGIGLSNVRNRVDYLHGNMEISSVLSEGTTFNIELKVA